MTVGSDMSVSAFNTSTTASATTAVFMHAISKPYTSSQNAMRSRCLSVSPTAARLMLQRSGYTNEGEKNTTLKTSNPGKNRSQTDINLQNKGDKNRKISRMSRTDQLKSFPYSLVYSIVISFKTWLSNSY